MLKVKNLSFFYQENISVLNKVSFELDTDKRTCILGESGSGKSTLLKLIYGHLDPFEGEIDFCGDRIKGPKYQLIPGHDKMKYVAQDFDLFPYMTVAENVGKHVSNIYLTKKSERINEILHILCLEDFANQKAINLSGGQMQRVAIARTLAKLPHYLVLDEPFSHLDASLHITIRQQLMQYALDESMGILFSSHRADDALGYADELIILKSGKVVQKGTPQEVYLKPNSIYVAKLFGKVNILTKQETYDFNLNQEKETCLIYPQEIRISKGGKHKGIVEDIRFIGRDYEVDIVSKNSQFTLYHSQKLDKGQKVCFDIHQYRWV